MAATYEATIAGTVTTIQPGWSHDATANGRDTFQCEVLSKDGSYRPAAGAVFIFTEHVALASYVTANPIIVTTVEPHGIVSGQTVTIAGNVGGVPSINGEHVATRIDATRFSFPLSVGDDPQEGTGGTVARRLIGGRIETPDEGGLGGRGVVPIITRLDVVDYNAQAENRVVNEVLAAGTLLAILTRLGVILGLTIHPNQVIGPSLDAIPCDYATLKAILDKISEGTGYVWEFDDWNRLRMFLPGSEAAPVNVVDGNGVAEGDVRSVPSRTNYRNRIIVRFTRTATAAWGHLFSNGNVSHGDTVSVGGQTYTFRSALSNVAGYVQLGGNSGASLDALHRAITLTGTPGLDYAAATVINASVTAWRWTDGSGDAALSVRALTTGAAGNAIVCTETAANLAWGWEGFGWGGSEITNLAGGADASLTNLSIATDASHATDPMDLVVESPNTTSQAVADDLAAAILANRLLQPKTVTYHTYALGLRPGQSQTITIAARNLNASFVLTDVNTVNTTGNLVLRSVTAVEGAVVQAAERFQDQYRIWQGGVSGSAAAVSGGGGGGGTTAVVSGAAVAGTINGSNVTFTLPAVFAPGSLRLNKNGLALCEGASADYTLSGLTVTLAVAPKSGDVLTADYAQ